MVHAVEDDLHPGRGSLGDGRALGTLLSRMREDDVEEAVDIPEAANEVMEGWLAENTGLLLHAWIADDDKSVLAVVATVADEAFDSETDGYDVDSIELHMLTMFDTEQGGWELNVDNEVKLGNLFGELANRFVAEEGML